MEKIKDHLSQYVTPRTVRMLLDLKFDMPSQKRVIKPLLSKCSRSGYSFVNDINFGVLTIGSAYFFLMNRSLNNRIGTVNYTLFSIQNSVHNFQTDEITM